MLAAAQRSVVFRRYASGHVQACSRRSLTQGVLDGCVGCRGAGKWLTAPNPATAGRIPPVRIRRVGRPSQRRRVQQVPHQTKGGTLQATLLLGATPGSHGVKPPRGPLRDRRYSLVFGRRQLRRLLTFPFPLSRLLHHPDRRRLRNHRRRDRCCHRRQPAMLPVAADRACPVGHQHPRGHLLPTLPALRGPTVGM